MVGSIDLGVFFGPPGSVRAIGPERIVRSSSKTAAPDLVVMTSREGSTRYLAHRDGLPVAVLQVVSADGVHARIANAYVVPDRRRTGLASMLLAEARRDFAEVLHSDMLSGDGRAFADATG